MRIKDAQAMKLIQKLEEATKDRRIWNELHSEWSKIQALLSFPLGELLNPKIEGFVLGWKLTGRIKIGPITLNDRFNAQGLEGAVKIETDLINALLVYRELPKFRRSLSTIQKVKEVNEE